MATREEQIHRLDVALRNRFFNHIPAKTNKPGWSADQHTTDRLSRALAAYSLVCLCNLDDSIAASAVTDGDDDGGIDALYFDRPQSKLVLIQSKYKISGTAPSQEENLKTINGVKALMSRRFTEFNAHYQHRMDEIEEALDTPGVTIQLVLVFLGEILGPHVTNDLNALQLELNPLSTRMNWDWCGLTKITSWLVDEQTPNIATIDVTLENWASVTAPRKAVYGQISASELASLVETHGKHLFERNIRHYLGSVGVNNAIAETARRRPADFFYLNNGLTAVATQITPAAGTSSRCRFRLTNASIVNGAQTAGSLATAASLGAISPDAKLLVTLIEIGSADDIGLRITRARNHQNVVRGVDFAAMDPNQERLRRELAVAGITYHYRPSVEARTRRDDAFTLEEAAVAVACLSFPVRTQAEIAQQRQGQRPPNAVDFVVVAKKEVGRLWDQEGQLYSLLFKNDLSAVRLCRLVRIYRFIDTVMSSTESSENQYNRRMFFRHGRYFIMAIVAHNAPEIIDRVLLQLTNEERLLLSRKINELAELVYAESATFQGFKGYLSIFRNLTDSQPLADRVLTRIAERARAAVEAAARTQE
jgi:hypothetical protein